MNNCKPAGSFHISKLTIMVILLSVLMLVAGIVCYLRIDSMVFEFLVKEPNEWHKNTWINAFRQLGKAWVPIWLALLWGVMANRLYPIILVLLATILVGLFVLPFKTTIHRNRPATVLENRLVAENKPSDSYGNSSFPSGDTATVFSLAVVLSAMVGWYWIAPIFLAAGAIGILRVTTMAHYPSDVCIGAVLGLIAGWITLKIARHWIPEKLPRIPGIVKWRWIAFVVLVLYPVMISLMEKINPLFVFLKTYGLLVFLIFLGLIIRNKLAAKNITTDYTQGC